VTEVKIGLGTVVGDKYLAVLYRIHGAGVNIHVRVKLLRHNAVAAHFEQTPERSGGNALAETRNNASGHKYIFHFLFVFISHILHPPSCQNDRA